MNAIEAIDLYKRFGKIIAVNGISFEVKEKEIFGFLGPNGAGKTTTIRMLVGLLKPDHGKAKIMGYDVHEKPLEAKSLIGVVPEEANPYPDLSALENLTLIGRLYNLSKHAIKERTFKLLKLLDLWEVRNRKVKIFSKGMKQKLLIAMALIGNPKVLFLDEPTSGLDVLSARRIHTLIQELKQNGVTIFLTTHNVEEAGNLCDRVAIIKNGSIKALGSPEELKIKVKEYAYVSISFDKPINDHDIKSLLKPYEYKLQGTKLLIVCNEPIKPLIKIAEYIKLKNLQVIDLQISQPSLEDVFIRIIKEES